MQRNKHHKTANKFSKNREESRHVTWESKGDHRVRSFVWRGGAPGMGGVRMGVKILCAQLAMDDLQAKLKSCEFSCP